MDFLCIGEPLIEMISTPQMPSRFDRQAGGDTLNTAVYLARLSEPGRVGYLSRLGDDAMSLYLRGVLAEEGLVDLCATQARGRPGLSFIATDAAGERSFTYWRDQSPARDLFASAEDVAALRGARTLALSAVTIAILRPQGRDAFYQALQQRRAAGAQIAFDTNFRPVLWPDQQAARAVMRHAIAAATLILPSLDDITACFGAHDAKQAMELLMGLTQAEIVLTTGGGPVLHRAAAAATFDTWPLPPPRRARDTTGAGDSFNAGWLAARQAGHGPAEAIARAARLAAEVVMHRGAIIPRDAMPAAASPQSEGADT